MIENFLESDRLYYEALSKKHVTKTYLDWLHNPIVSKYIQTDSSFTMDDLKKYVRNIEKNSFCTWAIITKLKDKHIGNIKIDPIDFETSKGTYGIMIGDNKEWGKGYAYEASERILEYCYKNLNLKLINLGVKKENKNAIELYKRLGFIKVESQNGYLNFSLKLNKKYENRI